VHSFSNRQFRGTAIDGTLEADSVSTDVDVSFSDIWDALDIAALGAFEARRGKLSLTTNVIYMKLSTDESKAFGGPIPIAPGGSFDVDAPMPTKKNRNVPISSAKMGFQRLRMAAGSSLGAGRRRPNQVAPTCPLGSYY
jgi:hypothetical protein